MTSFLKRDLKASKRFKAKLAAKELATLIHSSHPSPSLVERLGQHRFDAVLIDAEHGSVGRECAEEMSRAAALADIAAIMRPEGSLAHLVTGYLGCGVDGLMLPLIRTPEQARELAECFRISAPRDHADRVLILMIEHIEAVENIPALLDIEGVDAFLVAPSDMALSMGESFDPLAPRVLAVMDRAIDLIVASGKTCGMRIDFDTIEDYMAKGVTLLYTHTDHMIASGVQDYYSKVESARGSAARRI